MKTNSFVTRIAVCALTFGVAGIVHAAIPTTSSTTKKPIAKAAVVKHTDTTTATTSSNILPVAAVSPSFYVIGAPMLPDPVEPNAAPESRPGYSILPATPTLNAATPLAGSTEPGTLQAAIGIEPEYAVFNRLIVYSGLVAQLRKAGPFTLLAPTNSAFAKLPEETLNSLLLPENQDKLRQIISAHIIVGSMNAAQIGGMTSATTLNGNSFPVTNANGTVTIGSAKIVKADVTCANGIIQTIDTVLMP